MTVSEDLEETRMEDEGRERDESGSEDDEGRVGCKHIDDETGSSEEEMIPAMPPNTGAVRNGGA